MNVIRKNIPNCITCINVLCGCLAIAVASKADAPLWGLRAYEWAFLFVGIGAVADFFDGFAARALGAYSDLGKELDSLCDLVTFGVAPGMILFHVLQAMGADCWLSWSAMLIPVAGAVRLARFNVDTRQATTFIGLPIPANAIFWIGYVALAAQDGAGLLCSPYVLIPVLAVECWLMNSPLRIFSLKFKSMTLKENWPRLLLAIAAVVLCFTLGVGGLMWLIVFYVLLAAAVTPQK